ncbi:signal peptidase I [Arsenicicoccus dermatophilus]|uniref:signal peptidase I n=1 Tax=Arsenicicoccus dermatophilus TaxID=1076331 RepID=UPI001F4D057F|nr:signal peptidase I [Arsenicicoccus dermatophilus]MCH8612900.1 signal peptidase I [Arsenicicoccus dermatophilus]
MSDDLTPPRRDAGEPDEVRSSRERGRVTAPAPDEARPGATRAEAQAGRRPGQDILHALREFVVVVVLAMVLSLAVKTWLMQAFYIPSGSMEDTLVRGDRVVVSKLTPSPFSLERGDIVVFEDPDHWLSTLPPTERTGMSKAVHDTLVFVGLMPNDSDNHLIKRVIGLPGDKVKCCTPDGKLSINGTAVTEPYLKPGDAPSNQPFDITVPPGRLWLMGDHRSDSGDSRLHDPQHDGSQGSVPVSKVVGRAVTVVWPLSDLTWLGQPSEVFASVPDPR